MAARKSSTDRTTAPAPLPPPPSGWTEERFAWTRRVGHFSLSVSYDSASGRGEPGGYRFYADGRRGTTLFRDVPSAQRAAERALRQMLTQALAELDAAAAPTDTEDDAAAGATPGPE
jgi:hypothetical protein